MKIGDIVMYSNEDKHTYTKSFYGAIGTVESYNETHIKVEWRAPGPLYFGRRVPYSHFPKTDFTVLVEAH